MSESRELTLAEWCAKLPSFHLVNEELRELREQVEKLTKERNAFQDQCIRLKNERAVENGQLAALAEQNAKMRKVLLRLACLGNGDQYGNSIGNCIAQEALSLPNLSSPVLNRILVEGMRMAAEICNKWRSGCDNRTMQSEGWAAAECYETIRAKADELEQSK